MYESVVSLYIHYMKDILSPEFKIYYQVKFVTACNHKLPFLFLWGGGDQSVYSPVWKKNEKVRTG